MKIVFLNAQRNEVASWAISQGFSWEEGPYGIGSMWMRGALSFLFEGFRVCKTRKEFDALVGQGHLGVVFKKGVLSFLGDNVKQLQEVLR